jgi:hypothetical protein
MSGTFGADAPLAITRRLFFNNSPKRLLRDICVALSFQLVGKSMHRTLLSLRLFICMGLTSPALADDSNPPHLNRAQSVINAFQVICQIELPRFEFDRIDAKATAMNSGSRSTLRVHRPEAA